MTTETKVEAVACHRVVDARGYGGGHVWRDGDIPADELAYWNGLNDGYIVERAYPASAITALEGEVADRDAVIECKNIDIRERDRALQTSSKRVKDLEALIASARRAIGDHHAPNDCYATGPLTGDEFIDLVQCPACAFVDQYDALTKESP